MGRILKRVPLDFDAPLKETWRGYLKDNANKNIKDIMPHNGCDECDKIFNHCDDDAPYCIYHNEKWRSKWFEEVPEGDAYQIWENTSEGSPITPLFETIEEACQYAADNCTVFGSITATYEEWYKMMTTDEELSFRIA